MDAQAVLDKVAELPLATWNYKAQDDSICHMGPMAQDFGLGLGDKTIDTIDPNGVALAAIQGLRRAIGASGREGRGDRGAAGAGRGTDATGQQPGVQSLRKRSAWDVFPMGTGLRSLA